MASKGKVEALVMRKTAWYSHSIFIACGLLILLASCTSQSPSPIATLSAPTSSPIPTATPTLTATPIPTSPFAPVLTNVTDYIGIGTDVKSFLALIGQYTPASQVSFKYSILLEGGDILDIQCMDHLDALVISDATVNRVRIVNINPDPSPIDDFVIHIGQFNLQTNMQEYTSISGLLSSLGKPLSDETVLSKGIIYLRSIKYSGLEVNLSRSTSQSNEDLWFLYNTVVSSELIDTPRGLHVGLNANQIAHLFSTGQFIMELHGKSGKIEYMTIRKENTDILPSGLMTLSFVDDVVSAIQYTHITGD